MYRHIEQLKRTDFNPFVMLQTEIDSAIHHCELNNNDDLKQKLIGVKQEIQNIMNLSIPFEELNKQLFDSIKNRLVILFESFLYVPN
jgi:hypothetical protein